MKIEGWIVDREANSLSRNGETVRLEPRVMAVLDCLASRAGRPVSRDDLMAHAWRDVVVGDDALNAAISKLRRVFEDDPRHPRIIETVPKVGYRFIARPDERKPRFAAASIGIAVCAVVVLALTFRKDPTTPHRMFPLTSDPGIEVEPAVSPGTGERVAYSWKGPAGDDWSIWVRTIGNAPPLQLTRGAGSDHHPAWSADGLWIAFIRTYRGACHVMRVPALGGDAEPVATCRAPVHDLDWSPDGRVLAWSEPSSEHGPHHIAAFDLHSARNLRLTQPDTETLGDIAVSFSSDGERFAFIRSPALGIEEIWTANLDGSDLRQASHLGGKIHGFDWADDKSLVLSSNMGGLFALWSLPIGGKPAWITGGPSDVDAPSIGANGRTLAFEQWNDEANLHRIDLASGQSAPLIRSSRWDWDPAYSPDGSHLAFISDRSGSPELWIAPATGADAVRRTSFRGPYVSRPRWSPDGATLAIHAGGDVWTIAAAGGVPRRVTSSAHQDLAPFWSKDGERIFFGSNRKNGWAIWSVKRDGSDARRELPGGWVGDWSHRGELVHAQHGKPGLWIGERRVIDDVAPLDAMTWTIHGSSIFHVSRQSPDEPVLRKLDLDQQAVTELVPLGAALRHSAIALAPDGATAVVARVDRHEADIVVLHR